MTEVEVSNPYKPGSGLSPPFLAGRRDEIFDIVETLDLIEGATGRMDRAPFANIIIDGPHGVGKTTLLNHAINEADKRGIHSAQINSDLLSGPSEKLVKHLFPDNKMKKAFGRFSRFRNEFKEHGNLRTAMPDFLSKKPLLLIFDDVHNSELDPLGSLCSKVQKCFVKNLPLSCVFAGPTGVPFYIRESAPFTERSNFLSINTLSRDEAREALEIPARETDRPLDPDALEILLDWAANYPYFIQLAGKHAWEASVKSDQDKRISVEDARKGLAEAAKQREDFYAGKFKELEDQGLVDYTAQLVRMIRESKEQKIDLFKISDRLEEMNEGMDHSTSHSTVHKLLLTGLFLDDQAYVSTGIPSMFDYIERRKGA